MNPVAPKISKEETIYAAGQPEYLPVRVASIAASPEYGAHARYLVTRWTLSDEERERVALGEDLYFAQLNWGGPMTPIRAGLREEFTEEPEPVSISAADPSEPRHMI